MSSDETRIEASRRILLDVLGTALLRYWTGRERDPSQDTTDTERSSEAVDTGVQAA